MVACTPPLGSKHTTPPLSSLGHLPAFSMAPKSEAMHIQTDKGHCRMRRVCQPSCPGDLLTAVAKICHLSSSRVKCSGHHPAVALGLLTRSHFGACGFRHSGHQASSLAVSRAFCPA